MPTGTPGSTLVAELNRLANGGTYPPISQYVDEAAAAKKWAISLGITPLHTDTVGILNEIAYSDDGPSQWEYLDYNGACNHIAGTTGLTANAALQQITGQSAFVPYTATQTAVGTQYSSAFCSPGGGAYSSGYRFNTSTGICAHPAYGDPFTPGDIQTVVVYEYSCPTGGTYNPVTGLCEQ